MLIESTGRPTFSASRLDTWMKCPLQAKFQYVLKLPRRTNAAASFGKCIHHALEFYNKCGDLEASILVFLDVWDSPEKLDATPDEWPKGTSYGSYRQRGLEVLRTYHDVTKRDRRRVIAVEREFRVPFGDFDLHGFIDLVEMRKSKSGRDELRVIDYKTNNYAPKRGSLGLHTQFTVYSYVVTQPEFWFGNDDIVGLPDAEELWPIVQKLKPKPIWYHLATCREYPAGIRDDRDYMRLYRVCVEVDKAMRSGTYVPSVSGDSCVFCPYTDACGVRIGERPDDES